MREADQEDCRYYNYCTDYICGSGQRYNSRRVLDLMCEEDRPLEMYCPEKGYEQLVADDYFELGKWAIDNTDNNTYSFLGKYLAK